MRLNPKYVMIALLAIMVAVAGVYFFAGDGDGEGGGIARTLGPIGAIVILLLLVGLSAGGRRPENRPDTTPDAARATMTPGNEDRADG